MRTSFFIQLLPIGILFSILISCKTSTHIELTTEQRKAIEDTIRSLGLIVEKAANQRNLQMSIDLFSDDPDFTFSEDGYIKPEKDKLFAIMKPAYDNWKQITVKYETIRVVALSINSGVFTGEGPWSVTDPNGNIMNGHLVSMFVFVNRNNKWQMIHGHTSHASIP